MADNGSDKCDEVIESIEGNDNDSVERYQTPDNTDLRPSKRFPSPDRYSPGVSKADEVDASIRKLRFGRLRGESGNSGKRIPRPDVRSHPAFGKTTSTTGGGKSNSASGNDGKTVETANSVNESTASGQSGHSSASTGK
jgi:hypothetical protein